MQLTEHACLLFANVSVIEQRNSNKIDLSSTLFINFILEIFQVNAYLLKNIQKFESILAK